MAGPVFTMPLTDIGNEGIDYALQAAALILIGG
jgi:hypothetical protein